MRDPFGFINYRTGPSPHTVVTAVLWSLVAIWMLTFGVQAGRDGWTLMQRHFAKTDATSKQVIGEYRESEVWAAGSDQTFHATPVDATLPGHREESARSSSAPAMPTAP